jgi:hypothetical protein
MSELRKSGSVCNTSARQFAQNLLSPGEGKLPVIPTSGLIKLLNTLCHIVTTTEELKISVK